MGYVAVYSKKDLSDLIKMSRKRISIHGSQKKNRYQCRAYKRDLHEFTNIIAWWIHQKVFYEELRKISLEHEIFTKQEREEILEQCIKEVEKLQREIITLLQNQILRFFRYTEAINLDGFCYFSLEKYKNKINDIFEECAERYMAEQDYLEFLDLLRYFVEVEECRFGTLHIKVQEDGHYQYYNDSMEDITKECMNCFMMEFEDETADPDDCLISILITLLPEKIVLHGAYNMNNKKFLDTLNNIFGNRLVYSSKERSPSGKKM